VCSSDLFEADACNVESTELIATSNDILHRQLLAICSDLTDEQVRFAHEAVDDRPRTSGGARLLVDHESVSGRRGDGAG